MSDAGGWNGTKQAGKVILSHSGSNTMWYANDWVFPDLDRAFFVVTNSKDDQSNSIHGDVFKKLVVINREK